MSPRALSQSQLPVVDEHRLDGEDLWIGAESATIVPYLIAAITKYPACLLRSGGIGNTGVELSLPGDERSDVGITRLRLAEILPFPEMAIVNPEVDMPLVGHGTVGWGGTSHVQI